jgi:hypothetical protein
MLTVEDFVKFKFKHQYYNTDLNYDSFNRKGEDIRIILLWGEKAEHFYDIPITWIVKHNLTIYKGKIETVEELAVILKTLEINFK